MEALPELWRQLDAPTTRKNVRIPKEFGFVSPTGVVLHPGDQPRSGGPFRRGPVPDNTWLPFHVIDSGAVEVAIVDEATGAKVDEQGRARLSQALQRRYGIVVMVDADAPGAAVARCVATELEAASAARESAFAIWGLKALGGWEESACMTCSLSVEGVKHARTVDLSVFGDWTGGRATVTVRACVWPWKHLASQLRAESTHVAAFDVDGMLAFNDAYGFRDGDLTLARVGSALTEVAAGLGARALRVDGNVFAVMNESLRDAIFCAERGRSAIEAMAIPFRHPSIETLGVVTVCAAVLPIGNASTLQDRARAAIAEAKANGANRVVITKR
ncbi:MAG: diguanylate cyclase [Myxococcota bacterium]